MPEEPNSLEQKLPPSVVRAVQRFMEGSVLNRWAEATETHLQQPARQFDADLTAAAEDDHGTARMYGPVRCVLHGCDYSLR